MAPKKVKAGSKEEPAGKKAKTEVKKAEEAPKKEEEAPKEEAEVATKVEEVGEQETDAPTDGREKNQAAIVFDSAESTLNVIPTLAGKVLKSLSDGGMQYLIAGARANIGVKAGRYMFEVKVLESLYPREEHGKAPQPKQLVRVGFSTAGSSLILGDGDGGVAFDSDGNFLADKKRIRCSQRFVRDQVVSVLLNLDPKSPNAHTVSLFKDGVRVAKPQPLPEGLKGKTLFPHISFRNLSVQVHFGPQPLKALPFTCRCVSDAAKADVEVAASSAPKDGKYEVLFPVGMPDEGTFDWLDSFLEKNPKYVELSDRKIQEWAMKSGFWRSKKGYNDKPEYNYGLKSMDDMSVRKALAAIAPAMPRHYIVMEVKQNLVAASRKENLKRFCSSKFKRVAHVVMGTPAADYKKRVLSKILEEKKKKAVAEWTRKKAEKERKKLAEKRLKEVAERNKKAQEAKKAAEEAKKKAAEEAKEGEKKEGEEAKKEEKPEEAKKEEAPADVKMEEEKVEEKVEEAEEEDEAPPEVELTEEEQKVNFLPVTTSDLAPSILDSSFAQFSIPEKAEGFDAINFQWEPEKGSKAYLQKVLAEKKITTKIEDLQPGEWFKTKAAEFEKAQEEWKLKLKQFKPAAKKAEEKANVNIFSVENVADVGNGEPLFASFNFEDWTLLSLRCDFYLLMAGYKKDVNDSDRIGIHESNFQFYYKKYFKKQLNPKLYGKANLAELLDLIKDTATLDSTTGVLTSTLEEEPEAADLFVRKTEDNRRERQRRIDAGDETARLKFQLLIAQAEALKKQAEDAEKRKKAQEDAKLAAAKEKALAAASKPAVVVQPAKPALQQPAKPPVAGKAAGKAAATTAAGTTAGKAAGKVGGGKATGSWGKDGWGKSGKDSWGKSGKGGWGK